MRKIARALVRFARFKLESVYLYSLALVPGSGAPTERAISIRRIDGDERETLEAIEPGIWTATEARRSRGDACYVATLEGRPAHFSWVQYRGTHSIDDAARVEPIVPGEIWIYHCVTRPEARRRGIYVSVLGAIVRDHSNGRYKRAWIYTTRSNRASQGGIARAGFEPVSLLRAVFLGPFGIPFRPKPIRRDHHDGQAKKSAV